MSKRNIEQDSMEAHRRLMTEPELPSVQRCKERDLFHPVHRDFPLWTSDFPGHPVACTWWPSHFNILPWILELQVVWLRGKSLWTGWNRSLSLHLWTDGSSGSVINLLWASMESCSMFLLLICKQDSFLPPTCFTGGADEVYNVCKKSLSTSKTKLYKYYIIIHVPIGSISRTFDP